VTPPAAVSSPRSEPLAESISWKRVTGIQPGSRPLVVWISDGADGTIERRTFDDESVRLASQAFRTVRITSAAARNDVHLAPYARSAPAMLVFSPDLARAKGTHGASLDARTALEAMRGSARTDLGLDLDAAIVRARTLLSEEKSVVGLKASLRRSGPIDSVRVAELDRRLATIRAEEVAVFRRPTPDVR
jgi:hypothetical protein